MKKTNAMNPNNDAYWQERGFKKRPKNWKELVPTKNQNRYPEEEHLQSHGGYTDKFWKNDY